MHCHSTQLINNHLKIPINSNFIFRHRFKEVHLCLLEDAIEYLLSKNAKMIIDVKGQDKQVNIILFT